MNYKLVEDTVNKSLYNVFEKNTEQVVGSFKDFREARKFLRHLNLGGSFDGWTPSFFLVDVSKIVKNK